MTKRFALDRDGRRIELPAGEHVAGRASNCLVFVDDPLVSRRHARLLVTDETVEISDLQSRNGVKVNHVRISKPTVLHDGDHITIGEAQWQFTVLEPLVPRDARKTVETEAFVPPPSRPTLRRPSSEIATGVLQPVSVIDSAFSSGDPAVIEHVVGGYLRERLATLQSGASEFPGLVDATGYALRLAADTRKPEWLDWIFDAYFAAQRVLLTHTVDELHTLGRQLGLGVTPTLKAYVAWLDERAESLAPTEQFVLRRLHSLAETLKHSAGPRPGGGRG